MYFHTDNKKKIPTYLKQFGCRDSEVTDEDVFFVTQYVSKIDRFAIGGTLVSEEGLECLKKLSAVEYLDLRGVPLTDGNLDCILHLENLEYLDIISTGVSADGISIILESFPKLDTLLARVGSQEFGLIEKWQAQYPSADLIIDIG
ncbi:hypothetical protein J0A67_04600 [Algoriphagus aestuariicola]|uniref:Uncharacterized protein n=1 Tax=Algoriphagus aestuariicola TaxID=1852016 RepID=A0ABS3BLE3_9BACT|nr:hypothetical protein [Algoriphagus aestuariicola]MBN7800127.1 hypothetical protein [Algoriphagus aestuariicola]